MLHLDRNGCHCAKRSHDRVCQRLLCLSVNVCSAMTTHDQPRGPQCSAECEASKKFDEMHPYALTLYAAMAKLTKRTKKFVKNKLEQTLQQRKTAKRKQKYIQNKGKREHKDKAGEDGSDDEPEAVSTEAPPMSVDEFLRGGFREGMDDDEEEVDEEEEDDDDMEEVDDMEDEEEHAQDLAQLAEKDPEFYKYLQENDQDLLNFGQGDDEDEGYDEVEPEEDEDDRVLTMDMLRQWQKGLLRHRSPRALRRLLLAFRAALSSEEERAQMEHAFEVQDSRVFSKLLITTLKYMPVVMEHHVPYKKMPDGRFKVQTHLQKWQVLHRLVRSYFLSVVKLLRTVPEADMVYIALNESAKMVPYVHQDRRVARDYVRVLLEQWSSGEDRIRIAAFSCLYVFTASASDDDMIDFCLKSTYHALIRNTRNTKPHTLEHIALMKNTACELYTLHPDASYQQAFGFIRQLAISLRNCLKLKTQEQFQTVLNWPYLHCLDFWSLVLAKTCHVDREQGEPSHMRPLIYPLVQVSLGVGRLVPMSRYFPLRLHIIQSMLRLMQATHVYIPLAPLIIEVLESAEFQRRGKGATLKPLDLATTFRAPAAYVRTRVYADQLAEEFAYVLLEFLATQACHIAFPELIIPIGVQLRRAVKTSPCVRLSESLRPLLDKMRMNATWIEQRRSHVEFAPHDHSEVDKFMAATQDAADDAPLVQALRLARKVREQKRRLLEKTAHVVGDDEE